MTPGSLFRLGGWCLCVSSVVAIVASMAGSLAYALSADQASPLWLSIQIISIVAALFFSLGLPAVYFYQAYQTRQAGLWGFILTEAANSIGGIGYSLVITIVTVTLSTTVLKENKSLVYGLYALSTVSSLFLFAGTGLFGFATLKGKVFPRNAALLLLAGCVVSLAQAYPDPIFSVFIGLVSQVCSYGAFLWMGTIVIRHIPLIEYVQDTDEYEQGEVEGMVEQEEIEQEEAEETVGQREAEEGSKQARGN